MEPTKSKHAASAAGAIIAADNGDGKKLLRGLILRAEEVLGKLIYKLEKTPLTLAEMVTMINSVHAFVDTWEKPLEDIRLDMLNIPGVGEDGQKGQPKERHQKEERKILEQISLLDLKEDEERKLGFNYSKMDEPAEPTFEFLEQSLTKYTSGQTGTGYLTSVVPQSTTFHMIDRSESHGKMEQTLSSLQNVTMRLETLPQSPSTIFGVELEGTMFRAVRSKPDCGWPFLKLLDVGDVLPFADSMMLYQLTKYYQNIPPLAIRCQLVGVADEPRCEDLNRYLTSNVYNIRKFEICACEEDNVLRVKLSAVPKADRNGVVKPKPQEPAPPEYKISEKTLTQEQLDILYEEPLNTTNVMKATLGYVPKDDVRICPFYDPKIQGCFKGAACRLEHVAKDPDGWTRDRALHKAKIRAQLVEPKIGAMVKLIPTTIVSVEEFYGQLDLKECSEGLRGLQQTLNDPTYVRDFREMDHKPYKPNHIGRCVISAVSPGQRHFCMVDRDHPDGTKLFAAMQSMSSARITQLPPPGEVFGVYLDSAVYRAVRNKPMPGRHLRKDFIRLLDTGEIIPYDDTLSMCALSEYYRRIPAFAIRCMLVSVNDDPFCEDLNRYLKKMLNSVQHFKVVSSEKAILFVELSKRPIVANDPFATISLPEAARPNVKPSILARRSWSAIPLSPPPKPARSTIFAVDPVEQNNPFTSIRFPSVPTAEKRFCPFNGSANSNCATGAHSKNGLGMRKDAGDDRMPIVPPVGSHLMLMPKFIRDVGHIWCHVVKSDYVNPDFREMELRMNDPEYVVQYRKLQDRPKMSQRVFAKYVDKRWYRAQVIRYFDERNVLVFYVDYGNSEMVRLEEVHEWDDRFSYLPYQAVLCKLSNLQPVKPSHVPAVVELNRTLLNKRIHAKIVDNNYPWEITIFDQDGFDFASGLVIAGLAKRIKEENEPEAVQEAPAA